MPSCHPTNCIKALKDDREQQIANMLSDKQEIVQGSHCSREVKFKDFSRTYKDSQH